MADLCLSLAEAEPEMLAEKIRRYDGDVSMIEVRLDHLIIPQIPVLPPRLSSRLLATCRPLREGGRFAGAEPDRIALLYQASEHGFDLVDLECDVLLTELPDTTQVVRSFHDFDRFYDDLDLVFQRVSSCRGDVHKLALQVSSTRQLVKLLEWMEQLPAELPRLIIGMSSFGQASRFLGPVLGNAWTYVSEASCKGVAPGQFGLREAKEVYRLNRLSRSSKLYGLLTRRGRTTDQVRIFNRLFQHYCPDHHLFPFVIDNLEEWIQYLSRTQLQFQGFLIDPSVQTPLETCRFGTEEGLLVDCSSTSQVDWIASQFQVWTGIEPDPTLVREIGEAESANDRGNL